MVPYTFAPRGWAFCNGQTLPISQNQALFSLIGTNYGGNGRTTFGLPNLKGRTPMHAGQGPSGTNYTLGQMGGTESVTLTIDQIPPHQHSGEIEPKASNSVADEPNPENNYSAVETTGRDQVNGYRSDSDVKMGASPFTTSQTGGSTNSWCRS